MAFADHLEACSLDVIRSGVMTGDLCQLWEKGDAKKSIFIGVYGCHCGRIEKDLRICIIKRGPGANRVLSFFEIMGPYWVQSSKK